MGCCPDASVPVLLSFPFVPSAEYCSLLRVLGFRSPPMPRTQRFPLLTKVEAGSDIKYKAEAGSAGAGIAQ